MDGGPWLSITKQRLVITTWCYWAKCLETESARTETIQVRVARRVCFETGKQQFFALARWRRMASEEGKYLSTWCRAATACASVRAIKFPFDGPNPPRVRQRLSIQ